MVGCRERTEGTGCLIDVEPMERIDDVLLVMILDKVGRPFEEAVTDGVGVEVPSWSSSSSPSSSLSLARGSRSSTLTVKRVEVVFVDGDFLCPTTWP